MACDRVGAQGPLAIDPDAASTSPANPASKPDSDPGPAPDPLPSSPESSVLADIHRAHADADTLLRKAAQLLDAAAALALSLGDAGRAIELADRAYGLTGAARELKWLLTALVEGGSAGRAVALVRRVDELEIAGLDPDDLVALRLLLSRAAAAGGDRAAGVAQAAAARGIMIGAAIDETTRARLELLQAELLRLGGDWDEVGGSGVHTAGARAKTGNHSGANTAAGPHAAPPAEPPAEPPTEPPTITPTPDHPCDATTPRELAGRALATASRHGQPEVACEAWLLLGILARPHDLGESTGAFLAARAAAQRHQLAFLRLRAHLELGIDEWLTGAGTGRLDLVAGEAARSGSVAAQCAATAVLALDLVLRGEHGAVPGLTVPAEVLAARAGLVEHQRLLSLVDAVSAAHANTGAVAAWQRYAALGGDTGGLAGHGLALARAFGALIEEDRATARAALVAAAGRPAGFLGLPPTWTGIDVLLAAVDGEPVGEAPEEILARAARAPRWNRLFLLLAGAVLYGRRGAARAAVSTVSAARAAGTSYRLAWNLGLRLVSEAGLRDGWGDVAAWLREADEYFQAQCHVAVTHACRTLLRASGAPVPQWRSGRAEIPSRLRSLGVTVREYEVLTVLQAGGGNRRIAEALHISPRTVEKHLASLLSKTGKRHRDELADLLARSW